MIVFLTDDVGWAEYGFQGERHSHARTSTRSRRRSKVHARLRFRSVLLADAGRPDDGPLPDPASGTSLTGRAGGGDKGAVKFGLPLTETTMADRLKALGYATCAVGKWHLGGPPEFLPIKRGFDEFYGTVANTPFFNPPNFVDSRVSAD